MLYEEKTVYILLTRSGTWFSRLIHLATDDCYTHTSIGLDGPGGPFYSFARKYERFALPAGLVMEEVCLEVQTKRQQIPCCLYELRVPLPVYDRLRREIDRMYAQKDRYHYNLLGAVACYFNPPPAPGEPLLLFPICGLSAGALRGGGAGKDPRSGPARRLLPDRPVPPGLSGGAGEPAGGGPGISEEVYTAHLLAPACQKPLLR